MNPFKTILTTTTLLLFTATASAQIFTSNAGRNNTWPIFDSSRGIQWPANSYRPVTPATRGAAGTCANGICTLSGGSAQCSCSGACTCGPNCSPQTLSGRIPPNVGTAQRDSQQYSYPLPPSAIQAPRPRTQPSQPALPSSRPQTGVWQPVSYGSNISWESDLRQASQIAQQTGRPLLVRVSADWCGYCQKMSNETFTDARVIRDINNGFVAVDLNADANRQLVQQLGVQSLPTTLIMTPDMRIIARESGFRSAVQIGQLLHRHMQRAQLETGRKVAAL